MSAVKPAVLIGVTTSQEHNPQGHPYNYLLKAYSQALVQAGACPVLIPCDLSGDLLEPLLFRLDGILFSGGGDIQPDRYRSQAHPLVAGIDEQRDQVELILLEAALQQELPFLGICRGLQLINVGLGGSLYEDVLDQKPLALRHDQAVDHPRSYLAHTVSLSAGTRLEKILGLKTARVNSLHHQGVRELAPGLQASAFSPDGLVEGVELPGYRFGVGVQWHPEWLMDQRETRSLFRAFVEAAGDGSSRRFAG